MKKFAKLALCALAMAAVLYLAYVRSPYPQPVGQIYLYGEAHSDEDCLNWELEVWNTYYYENNMRHLFVEWPYFYAEYMNLWMHTDSDEILEMLWDDYAGADGTTDLTKKFLKRIKETCPETVFHGTDVGHLADVTGVRYLAMLEENGEQDTEKYRLALENVEQGRYSCENGDDVYRENKMAENFIREFEALNGESVMGIYGGAHVPVDGLDWATGTVPCMGAQIAARYGEDLHVEKLYDRVRRVDEIRVNGKLYQASYFGYYLNVEPDEIFYQGCDIWRLEDAYEDMKGFRASGESIPRRDFTLTMGENEVYLLEYTRADGAKEDYYWRTCDELADGKPAMELFTPGAY